MWSRQESNLYLKFRKLLFYPLNYGTIYKIKVLVSVPFKKGAPPSLRFCAKIAVSTKPATDKLEFTKFF